MRLGSCRGWHVKHGDARTQGLWHVIKDVIHTHRHLHLIIEGLNHRQIAQYILWQFAAEVGIVALTVYRESVLHIKLLLTHVACREGGAQSVVLLVVLIVEARRSSMRRSGVHLDTIRLAHVHVAVGGIHREVVEEVPAHDGLQSDEVLLGEVGVFKVILHVVDAPYALYLLAEEVAIHIARDEEVIVRVLCAQAHVVVLLRLQVLVTLNHEHAEVVPVEEQLLDAWRTVAHRIVGSPRPVIRRTPLEGNLRHRHQSEGTAEVGSHTCRNHPVVVHRPLVLQESLRLF